jgi:hypothetical protein
MEAANPCNLALFRATLELYHLLQLNIVDLLRFVFLALHVIYWAISIVMFLSIAVSSQPLRQAILLGN